MEKNKKSYLYLFKYFKEEDIRERFIFLIDIIKKWARITGSMDYISIDFDIIDHILCDYFADIQRLKEFHEFGENKANAIKVSAYLCYWISKRKPLSIVRKSKDKKINNKFNFINEKLAMGVMLIITFKIPLNANYTKIDCGNSKKHEFCQEEYNKIKVKSFLDNLYYFFKYRHINPQSLELTLNALNIKPIYVPREDFRE